MAERGWWGGLLDETAKLPQGIKQLVVDAVTRQPRTDPTQPVVTPGPGGLLDLTPVPGLTEAYKASDDVGKGGYEGGKAVGTYLSGLLGIIPAVGAVRKAGPIRAYHGSPHSFDKFDLNKIGTGEGAQAYGHGLYFAENEGVARGYRDQLSSPMFKTPDGTLFDPQSQLQHVNIRVAAHRNGSDLDATIARAEQLLPKASEQTRPMIEHDIAVLRSFKDQGGIKTNSGHMYEVGIHADPAKMLDWDKPLSRQHPDVDAALASILRDRNRTPGDWIKSSPGAEARMQEAGIPGIKYLDQGSRTAGAGTNNYVVFDPKIIEIMRKYGIPIGAGGAAAATVPGLLNQEQQY